MSRVLERIREYANREPNDRYIGRAVGAFIFLESFAFHEYILKPYFFNNVHSSLVSIINAFIHFILLFPLFSKLFGWSKSK